MSYWTDRDLCVSSRNWPILDHLNCSTVGHHAREAMSEVDPGADENRPCGLRDAQIAKNSQDSQTKRRARRVAGDHNLGGMNRFMHSSRRGVRQVEVCISVSISPQWRQFQTHRPQGRLAGGTAKGTEALS